MIFVVFFSTVFQSDNKYCWQSEPTSPRSPTSGAAIEAAVNGTTSSLDHEALGLESAAATSGNFFEDLTSSQLYKNTKVVCWPYQCKPRSDFVLLDSCCSCSLSLIYSYLFMSLANSLANRFVTFQGHSDGRHFLLWRDQTHFWPCFCCFPSTRWRVFLWWT